MYLYCSYPSFPKTLLQRKVGVHFIRFPGCPATAIFYPACTANKPRKYRYAREELLQSISEYAKLPRWCFSYLLKQTPYYEDAVCAGPGTSSGPSSSSSSSSSSNSGTVKVDNGYENSDNNIKLLNNNNKYPIVFFSHGLFGSLEIYSFICAKIASLGYIVVSLEHEDGTALFARSDKDEVVPYKRPPTGLQYVHEDVSEFRKPFLQQRLDELQKVISAFCSDENESYMNDVVKDLRQKADFNRIVLSGHSFGE